MWYVVTDTYPEEVKKMYFLGSTFYYYYWEHNYVQIGNNSSKAG